MLDAQDLRSDLARVMRPLGAARGLPNALYGGPAALELEKTRIFHDGWACIGFGKDVPNPGDVAPFALLGAPMILARDHQGAIRVYQNVCRHRGMILVTEARNYGGVIRCPYHSWCYSLDGKLRATPHVGGPGLNTHEAVDRATTGLIEVRVAVMMDMVFVNVSGDAPPFEEATAELRARWADFVDRPLYHGGPESGFRLEVACNWKLAVENYCESYHLPWVHPGLNSYSRLEDHYNIEAPRRFSGQGTLVYNPALDPDLRFPDFPGLPEKWDTSAEYLAVYPNVLLGVHRDHVFAIRLEPVAHDRTLEHVEIYYASEEAARGAKFLPLRSKNATLWKQVFQEDVFVVEGMQRGRAAPGFDGGVFSPAMDAPTHCFHDWVASRLA